MGTKLADDFFKRENFVEIGGAAPDFILPTEKEEKWMLSDHAGKVIVLLFYPKDETLVCTRQMCSLRDHWEEYLQTKAVIVGISPGTTSEHRNFAQRHKLPLTLLADEDLAVTRAYAKHWLFHIKLTRAVAVIDANGILRARKIMLRAFKPSDNEVLTSIYSARGDALKANYEKLRKSFWETGEGKKTA